MRVVLDTTVLISAFVFPGGAPEAVFRIVLGGDVDNVTSAPLLAELGRVLQDKFGWDGERSEAAVRQVLRVSLLVDPHERIDVVADDHADNRILEAAISGASSHIISGDQHLLTLRRFRGVDIVTPRSVLTTLTAD